MPTITRRGSGTPVTSGTVWTTVTSAVDGTPPANPATYAVWTSSTSGAAGYIDISGYDFSAIPAGSIINSVTVDLRHFENNITRIASVTFTPMAGAGYGLGTAGTATRSLTARNDSVVHTTSFIMDLAELQAPGFKIRASATRAAVTQSATFNVDHVDVTVDYSGPVTQAAYRFYDDGTETGSTALASQDTAPSVNVGAGDANVQLRVRLQATSAVAVDATADWQLQCRKNSGVWANVATTEVVTDSYPDSQMENYAVVGMTNDGLGQSFTGNGYELSRATFGMMRVLNPTGTIVARLYAHTGSYGAGGTGTGTPLAISTNSVSAASVSTSATMPLTSYSFDFDGTYTLVNGTNYCIVVYAPGISTATDFIRVGHDQAAPTHPGSRVTLLAAGGWAANTGVDLPFAVYTTVSVVPYDSANLTDGAATTNRLGAGSGSFVAGKVSEDALADNVGWTANNYTELLYSITLKQAQLADGDTLQFRVLNGTALLAAYTQTPTIAVVTSVGPSDQTWSGSIGTIGVAGVSGSFVASGTVVWDGSIAAVGVAGITGAFEIVVLPQTWSGSTATVGVEGVTGSFVASGTVAWSGSTATVGVAGITAAFVAGAAAWSGSTATVGVEGITGVFSSLSLPQTWSGSTATVGVAGITATFVASGTAVWDGTVAAIGVGGVTGAFSALAPPQTWSGSTATIGVAGITAAFVPSAVVWSGSTATVGVTGVSGSFVASGTVAWSGSTATVGVAGITGSFVTGVTGWSGSTALVGVLGVSGAFVGDSVAWSGSVATIGVAAIPGAFSSTVGPQTWAGTTATLGVLGVSGTFVEAATPQTWQGSVAQLGVTGISQPFATGLVAWSGSLSRIGVEAISGSFDETAVPQVWAGSIASIGVTGTSLEWNANYFIFGMWNGQYVVGMMYNAAEVVEMVVT